MRGDVQISEVIIELERSDLLPAIVFRTARNQCDIDVEKAGHNNRLHLSSPKQRELALCVKAVIKRYDLDEELIVTHPHYSALLLSGVGAHHAGQLLMWRLLLEELMAAGLLRVLVATGTVAAGVDFPARTVVITAHSKRGADGFNTLTSTEFQQMSGRAGRRGKDTVGFCIAAPAPFCDARALLRLSRKTVEPLTSAYFPSPSTVLNLMRYRNVDDLRFTVQRSLASFVDRQSALSLRDEAKKIANSLPKSLTAGLLQMTDDDEDSDEADNSSVSKEQRKKLKKIKRNLRNADELECRQAKLLDETFVGLSSLGYLEGLSLSEKGYWAANLCTSLVLELAEIISKGLLTGITREKLVAIIAAISADSHRPYLEAKEDVLLESDVEALSQIIEAVTKNNIPGVLQNREISLSAAYTAVAWMSCENWQAFRGLLFLNGVTEGDAARLITQTAEQLNQIARLVQTHPELAQQAEIARLRILRPPLTEAINVEAV